jgi:hypothetical protein
MISASKNELAPKTEDILTFPARLQTIHGFSDINGNWRFKGKRPF